MARECAAGKEGAPVLPRGPARGRCVQEFPTCSLPVETPSARGNTLFLLPPGVSQLKPLKLQRSRPSWCLGNMGTNGTLDLLPRHWDHMILGFPSPSSPRNIGSSRSSLQQKTQNEDLFSPLDDSGTPGPSSSPREDPAARGASLLCPGKIEVCTQTLLSLL